MQNPKDISTASYLQYCNGQRIDCILAVYPSGHPVDGPYAHPVLFAILSIHVAQKYEASIHLPKDGSV